MLMKNIIPTELQTERLNLRTFQDEDWKDLHEYYSDETCMKYTIGHALTEGETWRAMASMVGHWNLRGYGPYVVVGKNTRKVLGVVGLWFPNDWPEPEIKWGLAPHAWGKGYAREAAFAVKEMAYSTIKDCNLISLIDVNNKASIRVANDIGAELEKEIVFREKPCYIYRHSKT